jgi:putative Ca2+/H+ antiporter (TMEM165/GDT1 family)
MITFETISAFLSTSALISLAELGDKSQLVCMTLAARHRHWPVLLGAVTAFTLLNILAVLFGASVAAWVPERVMAGVVAVLFCGFGVHALYSANAEEATDVKEKASRGIFFTTFLLIFVAEFGDKTQIAVAALAGSLAPLPVWAGATVALAFTSALGVWAGRTLLQRLPIHWLHRISGVMFIGFGLFAAWHSFV